MANCEQIYREYITCLNSRDLDNLKHFVHDDVCYNGNQIGISGYQKMLEKKYDEITYIYLNIT